MCRVDEYRALDQEPLQSRDMDPAFVALHKRVTQRNAQILYKGTRVNPYSDAAALPESKK